MISKHSLCVPTAAACKGNPLYLLTGGGVIPTSGHAGETGQSRRRKSKILYYTHEKRAETGLKCFRVDLYRYGHKKPNLAKIQSVDKGIKKSRLQRTARADGRGVIYLLICLYEKVASIHE